VAIATSALWGLIACSASGGESRACDGHADCAVFERCQQGTCFQSCRVDAECQTGERCSAGLCVDPIRCTTTENCPPNTVCEDRFCRSQTPQCQRSSDCPPDFACINQGCRLSDGPQRCISRSDCPEDHSCVDNQCLRSVADLDAGDTSDVPTTPGDVENDVEVDTGEPNDVHDETGEPDGSDPPDAARDTRDAAETLPPDVDPPEPECVSLIDCPVGTICDDGVCVTEPEPDPCEGRANGRLGDRCENAADCCNGLCLGNPIAGFGRCSESCASWRDCNPIGSGINDLFCASLDVGDGTTRNLCATNDASSLCASAADCVAGFCLRAATTSSCTWECTSSADCDPGRVCGVVEFGTPSGPQGFRVCTPIGNYCAARTDCLSGLCLAGLGTDYCTTFCNAAEPGVCGGGYVCTAAAFPSEPPICFRP